MPQLKGKHAKEFRKKIEQPVSEETKHIFEEAREISEKIKHEETRSQESFEENEGHHQSVTRPDEEKTRRD